MRFCLGFDVLGSIQGLIRRGVPDFQIPFWRENVENRRKITILDTFSPKGSLESTRKPPLEFWICLCDTVDYV